MAATYRQRRIRAWILGIVIAVVLVGAAAGKEVLQLVFGPKLAGYLTEAPAGSFTALAWPVLHNGQWEYDTKPIVPQEVAALDGQQVSVHGFLLPLHESGASAQFFIAEKPRGCYFCNPPGIAEVVTINLAGGKALEMTDWPVTAYGTLHVATGAEGDAVLYRLEDVVLAVNRK